MENKRTANDKLHDSNLGKVKDVNELKFNKDSNSFEFDIRGEEHRYDHPLPYDTSAPNGEDSSSSYDESNPFLERDLPYKAQIEEAFEEYGMHVDETGESLNLDDEDRILARTAEDLRDDLDEEGYPTYKK